LSSFDQQGLTEGRASRVLVARGSFGIVFFLRKNGSIEGVSGTFKKVALPGVLKIQR